jgi:hypothetical protein
MLDPRARVLWTLISISAAFFLAYLVMFVVGFFLGEWYFMNFFHQLTVSFAVLAIAIAEATK